MAVTLTEFEQHLQDSLTRLSDPTYQHSPLVMRILEYSTSHPNSGVRNMLLQAIRSLDPSPELSAGTHAKRFYAVLSLRYVQGLTQKETAAKLNITPRHLRRIQQQAIQMLALELWQPYQQNSEPRSRAAITTGAGAAQYDMQTRRTQMQQELAALQQNDPKTEAGVGEEIERVVRLMQPMLSKRQIQLSHQPLSAGLKAIIHPALLRQLLIMTIEQLTQNMGGGAIKLKAYAEDHNVCLVVSGEPVNTEESLWSDLVAEIAMTYGGDVHLQQDGSCVTFTIRLVAAGKIVVFVIDDNTDLVYLYHRYTATTQYQVNHFDAEGNLFQQISRIAPDIIVLDIMLPNIDGWELLIDLREHPSTRRIPIIVCSVVSHEELALGLGAKLCLTKPIRRQEFIQALDQVQGQV